MTFPWTDLTLLAECLCRELAEAGRPETCFCGVIGGAIAPLDFCGECDSGACGQAWVRLSSMSEVQFTVDTGGVGPSTCATPLEATVEVGVTRCAPTMDSEGNPPSMAEQLAAAEAQTADMMAALRAIRCCYDGEGEMTVESWTPIGPDGICMGGVWSITITEY